MNPSFCFIVRMFDFVQNNRIMRKRFRDNDFFMFSEVHASFRLLSEFFVTDKLSDMIEKKPSLLFYWWYWGWIPGILGFLNPANESWIWTAQIEEFQKSF